MPIKKFRDVAEMDGNTWRNAGDPELFRAIRACWSFAARTLQPTFPPGVYKHRSIEDAEQLREQWAQANFERYQARQEAQRRRRSDQ
jgi:hypothetical protein